MPLESGDRRSSSSSVDQWAWDPNRTVVIRTLGALYWIGVPAATSIPGANLRIIETRALKGIYFCPYRLWVIGM